MHSPAQFCALHSFASALTVLPVLETSSPEQWHLSQSSRGAPDTRKQYAWFAAYPWTSRRSVRLLVLPRGQPVSWTASDRLSPTGPRGVLSWAFSVVSSLIAIQVFFFFFLKRERGKDGKGRGEKNFDVREKYQSIASHACPN